MVMSCHQLHWSVRRPHGHGRVQRLLRLHPVGRRHAKWRDKRRSERLQLLDGWRRRRRLSADGLLAERSGHRWNHRASRTMGSVHPRRLQRRRRLVGEHGDGERQSRHRERVRGELALEQAQTNADSDSFKDQETNDYLGLAVHCAQASAFCANATAVKYGQTTASNTEVPESRRTSQEATTATTRSSGTRSSRRLQAPPTPVAIAPLPTAQPPGHRLRLGPDRPNGNQINGQYVNTPGFPGFGPITAAQSLAYTADMQESGVPITYAYISDVHAVASADAGPCSPASTYKGKPDVGDADGPGDNCYYQTTASYDAAFATFLKRLADDGITPQNTEFVFGADEGDHFSGANVGRAQTPSCTGTPLTTSYICNYTTGQVGEVEASIHGLLQYEDNNTTPFASQPQGESVYVTGNQPAPVVRQLERDFGTLPSTIRSTARQKQRSSGWSTAQARSCCTSATQTPPESRRSARSRHRTCTSRAAQPTRRSAQPEPRRPQRRPPARPSPVSTPGNHGYYAPEINNTWIGLVGPGVKTLGIDGSSPGRRAELGERRKRRHGNRHAGQQPRHVGRPGRRSPDADGPHGSQGRLHRGWTRPDR